MAERNDKSKSRPTPNRTATKPRTESPIPEPVTDVIEEERLRLMKAHSVLTCVGTAMEAEDDGTSGGPYYPALIEVAGELVNESIRQLDSVNLRRAASRLETAEDETEEDEHYPAATPRGPFEVREPRVEYGVRQTEADADEVRVPEVTTH